MERVCICGNKVTIPNRRTGDGSGNKKNGRLEVKCPECGATAPLRVKLRNGRVKGLKEGWLR